MRDCCDPIRDRLTQAPVGVLVDSVHGMQPSSEFNTSVLMSWGVQSRKMVGGTRFELVTPAV